MNSESALSLGVPLSQRPTSPIPPPAPPPQPVSLGGILPPCARDPFLPLSGNVLAMGAEDGGEPGRLEQRQPVGGEAHLRVMALW